MGSQRYFNAKHESAAQWYGRNQHSEDAIELPTTANNEHLTLLDFDPHSTEYMFSTSVNSVQLSHRGIESSISLVSNSRQSVTQSYEYERYPGLTNISVVPLLEIPVISVSSLNINQDSRPGGFSVTHEETNYMNNINRNIAPRNEVAYAPQGTFREQQTSIEGRDNIISRSLHEQCHENAEEYNRQNNHELVTTGSLQTNNLENVRLAEGANLQGVVNQNYTQLGRKRSENRGEASVVKPLPKNPLNDVPTNLSLLSNRGIDHPPNLQSLRNEQLETQRAQEVASSSAHHVAPPSSERVQPLRSNQHITGRSIRNRNSAMSKSLRVTKRKGRVTKIYTCMACKRGFLKKSNCMRHVNIVHLKHRNYKCNHCDKCFATKQNMENHVNVHRKNDSR